MAEHNIIILPDQDERPHAPGSQDLWQESVVLTFQDIDQKVGGFIRIGHQPNQGKGRLTFGVISPNERYARSLEDVPLKASDRHERGFAIDDFVSAEFDGGTSHWRAENEECALDLLVTNLHDQFDVTALRHGHGDNDFHKEFNTAHTEVAGLVRGSVRIGKKTYRINGYGFRDHSWGVRNLANPKALPTNFFWLIGSFGQDFVFSIAEVITRAGERLPLGFVIRDGEFDIPLTQDVSFEINLDGVTMRRMRIDFDTPKFGAFSFTVEGFGNVLLSLGEHYLESGMPAVASWGERTGGAHVSAMFNARGGTGQPPRLFGTSPHNGLYRSKAFRAEWPETATSMSDDEKGEAA